MFQAFDQLRETKLILIANSILLSLAFGIMHSLRIFIILISENNQWSRGVFVKSLAFENFI
jgi:hypothetical protein